MSHVTDRQTPRTRIDWIPRIRCSLKRYLRKKTFRTDLPPKSARVDVPNIITCAKFQNEILRGTILQGSKFRFSYWIFNGNYNSAALLRCLGLSRNETILAAANAWDADYCYRWSRCLSVSMPVCLSHVNSASLCGWTDQDAVWGEHSWGTRNIVLDGDPYPPQRERGKVEKILPIVDSLRISRLAKTRDLCRGWGLNQNSAKVGYRG